MTGDYGGPRSFEKDQLMTILSQSKLVGQNFRYASEVVSELSKTAGMRWVGFHLFQAKDYQKSPRKLKKKRTAVEPPLPFCAKKGNIYVQIFNCDGKVPAIVSSFFSQYTFCKGLGPEMVTNLTLHSTKYKHGWNFTNGFRYHESYPKSTPENSSLLATMFGR